jgi:hypothetical protein
VSIDLAGTSPVLLKKGFVFRAGGAARNKKGDSKQEEKGGHFHGAQRKKEAFDGLNGL